MDIQIIDRRQLKLNPATMGALDNEGRLVVHPAAYWQQFNQQEISAFCVMQGVYCIPTTELVEWLKEQIAGQLTIEVGAGNGVLADALGITATDNKMQQWPEVELIYRLTNQTTVKYGANVRQLDANEAVFELKPQIVIGAWVTHRSSIQEHWRGGNIHGVVEETLLRQAKYCFIGNRAVHSGKPILQLEHEEHSFPWLVSRAFNPEENFIGVWEKLAT